MEGRSPQRFFMPGLVLSLGTVSVALLFVNDSIRERVLVRDAEVTRQVAEVQTRLATLHLWVEEYVTGDTVDLEEVQEHQTRSREIVGGLLGTGDAPLVLDAEETPEIHTLLTAIQPQVERFIELSSRRLSGFDNREEVGIGSVVDVEYDDVFNGLLDELEALDALVVAKLDSAHAQSRSLFRLMVIAWIGILAISVAAIWSREHRHERAEMALKQSEAKLLQAQKMEAIGSLAGGLAHDINNYLAAISAQCEVVRMRSAPDDPVAQKMDTVMGTCSRASALLERLLAFSRGQPIHPEVISLNRVVSGLDEMAQRLIGEHVVLDLRLERDLWATEVGVSQIEQVILNLLVNARDAMPKGGEVRVETRNAPAGSNPLEPAVDAVCLRVSDTGPGIAREYRDKIFEPFFTTKEKSTNSGLGLATVYGIVRQNHGDIVMSETPGHGATFDLFFPRVSSRPNAQSAPVPEPSDAEREGRVLLVEDNDELRISAAEILREMGFEVRAAANGEEALEWFEKSTGPIDLLLTDVVMPGLNGAELAAEIRRRDPEVKVLFSSGYTDNLVLSHGVSEGAPNFLPKPFSGRDLVRAISEVLDSD